MKAVILAGTEGRRLRPLTLGGPKTMMPLFGKPVMGHLLDLLRRHGVQEIAVTLQERPQTVMDFFGDGRDFGVQLTYFVEETPRGTAGSVKLCLDFLGNSDFLVVQGDAVCDLDLTELAALHQSRRSVASLALSTRIEPLEYGLVRTDDNGRVIGFLEKPGWGQVDTEQVYTGIAILSRRALDRVPDNQNFDFGTDLFPKLLAQGEPLYGWEISGYWQDIQSCEAYLNCAMDALTGKVQLDFGGGLRTSWPGVTIRTPCWIGERVSLAPGCTIGPGAVLGDGSTVEAGAVIERSILLGAFAGEEAEISGAILCRGAAVHRRATLSPGVVLGESTRVGSEATLAPGIKLWPGRSVPDGSRLAVSLVTSDGPPALKFSDSGVGKGILGEDLPPELLLSFGTILGERGIVSIGWAGGPGAGMLGRAAGCGAVAAGGTVLVIDAPCPSAAAWLGQYQNTPVTLFVQQDGEQAELYLFDAEGLPLQREARRKLEGALLRGEGIRVPAGRIGRFETITGTRSGYAGEAARQARLSKLPLLPLPVQVPRGSDLNDTLAAGLTALGCRVSRGEKTALPTFSADLGGFRLTAWDETGHRIPPERLLVLLTLIEFQNGQKRCALPAWAPASAERVAESFGGVLLRLGRDGPEADAIWKTLPWMRDAVFAACRIASRMGLTGEKLADLDRAAPKFATVQKEVPLSSGRGRVMEEILSADPAARRQGIGVRSKVGAGWVYLVPVSRRGALRVMAEAVDMETAEELCGFYAERIQRLDRNAPPAF